MQMVLLTYFGTVIGHQFAVIGSGIIIMEQKPFVKILASSAALLASDTLHTQSMPFKWASVSLEKPLIRVQRRIIITTSLNLARPVKFMMVNI